MLSVLATAVALLIGSSAQAQPARAGVPVAGADPIPGLRGFSVVLVQGDLKPGATTDNVPAAAAKALADLKDFLPYRSYQALDTQWTMGSGQMTGRLRGPQGKEYDLEVMTQRGPTSDAPVIVARFVLREIVSNKSGDRFTSLYEKGLVSRSQVQQMQGEDKSRAAFATLMRSRPVIDTTFSMNLGETVVVGTSRLQGDTALIVLLTAVSRDGSTRGGR